MTQTSPETRRRLRDAVAPHGGFDTPWRGVDCETLRALLNDADALAALQARLATFSTLMQDFKAGTKPRSNRPMELAEGDTIQATLNVVLIELAKVLEPEAHAQAD